MYSYIATVFLKLSCYILLASFGSKPLLGLMKPLSQAIPVMEGIIPEIQKGILPAAINDTVSPPIYSSSLLYGVDKEVSPCDDMYQFANGGWRRDAVMPVKKDVPVQMITYFNHVARRIRDRMETLIDSAARVHKVTPQHTLRVIGEFYESCMVADTLEPIFPPRKKTDTTARDSTRAQMCTQRVRQNLSEVAGQFFAEELKATNAVNRMEILLEALKTEVIEMLKENTLMTDSEKDYAVNRLNRLVLRVGIPKTMVEYSGLRLDTADYYNNKLRINSFLVQLGNQSIGNDIREKWKLSLLTPNAVFMPLDHAIEIPTLMFSPPFFYAEGEDYKNFAGVGYVIGHEIFHSVTPQIHNVSNPDMKREIEALKKFSTSMGELDGWISNGDRTFNEDVADLGGGRVAYRAWKRLLKKQGIEPALAEGYTSDQSFFIALAKIWRSKWQGGAPNHDVHAPHFARVNMTVMQMPEFAQAFGCKEGDRMYLAPEDMSSIW